MPHSKDTSDTQSEGSDLNGIGMAMRSDDINGHPKSIPLAYEMSGLDEGEKSMDDEALPNIEYYTGTMSVKKVLSRPTLRELHGDSGQTVFGGGPVIAPAAAPNVEEGEGHTVHKFGWIRGVLIRTILSIVGTLLYMRMGWVAGRAGLGMATVIVALSALITVITALSMSALCTNGEIKAGGAYFMLSRSLGPEFGGTMGVIFALADAVASAMNVVGFAECIRDTLKDYGLGITGDPQNDVRIIAFITEIAIFTIVMISVSWEAKIELVLIVIVVVSFVNYVIGTFIPPSMQQKAQGFTGYSLQNFKTNFAPDWRGEHFITVFSVYFPSITGILSGAGISGELKEPNTAIPKGTLLGILLTTLVYLASIWLTGLTALRDASGDVGDLVNGTLQYCAHNQTCKFGLQNDNQIMSMESGWWPLILAGVFATSVSSALTLIVSSPRTIQALCKDKLFPRTEFLAKGSGKDHEPRRAYTLVMLIGLIMIGIGDLNAIAPLISNFYLASFMLINYACFDGSLAKSPGWRPAFKYYNMWVSLVGAILCVVAMFVMSWPTALGTVVVMFFLYMFLLRRKPDANWGSSSQAHVYRTALQGMQNLLVTPEHVKNYRPQILCLTGNPIARCCLADFVWNITRGRNLLICGNIMLPGKDQNLLEGTMREHVNHIQSWLRQRKVKAFYSPAPAPNFYDGVKMLIQTAGLGKLQPNILFVGFKANWRRCPVKENVHYFKMIHEVFDANLGLCILRVGTGLDCTEMLQRYEAMEANRFHDSKSAVYPGQKPTDPATKTLPLPKINVQNMSFSTIHALHMAAADNDDNTMPSEPSAPAPTPPQHGGTRRPTSTVKWSVDNNTIAPTTDSPPSYNNAVFSVDGETNATNQNNHHLGLVRRGSDISMASSSSNVDFMRPITVDSGGASSTMPRKVSNIEEEITNDSRPLSMIEEIGQRMRSFRKRHHLTPAQREVVFAMNQFREPLKKARIDVYWLFDDGGLTVLIPHLLTLEKSFLEKARLRIFTLSSNTQKVKVEEEKLKEMLTMFRIQFEDVIVLTDWYVQPKRAVIADFENTIAPYRVSSINEAINLSSGVHQESAVLSPEFCITDHEVQLLKDTTARYLRTREIVMENSKEAQLIVLTAPVPKKGKVSACMYMAWMDMLTRDLTPYNAPVLLIRGNQQSVLTFYS